MVVMTPEILNEYLQVMRNNGVQAGAMEIPWALSTDISVPLKMSFHFEPKLPDEATPAGGWKAPQAPAVQTDLQTRGLDEQQLPEIEL
jgi:hypothetical protein